MIFNGLTKSDLIVFNALNQCDLSKPVPVSQLADMTCYHPNTIQEALRRLEEYVIIQRYRKGPGRPYRYILEDHALSNS